VTHRLRSFSLSCVDFRIRGLHLFISKTTMDARSSPSAP
jgi:hypothetical protein